MATWDVKLRIWGDAAKVVDRSYWGGLPLTLLFAICGITMAYPIGILLALGRVSSLNVFRYLLVKKFISMVNSSSVMVNTSTRFADGFEYGLGAEIGISTDKLHVRGPVGVEGLTSLKYVVTSKGKIRN